VRARLVLLSRAPASTSAGNLKLVKTMSRDYESNSAQIRFLNMKIHFQVRLAGRPMQIFSKFE
jgi:hypothetical protein